MAIPSRQIGGSTTTNLLWEISKQLERLICVRSGGCGKTTNYNVAGCERMEYHVISYTGGDILPEGTVVKNATPECWYIVDPTTNPADVGTVVEIWPTPADCEGCILSNPTTTTTTTRAPLVNTTSTFVNCSDPCGLVCLFPLSYFDVWMSQDCIDNWPQIGCQVFLDSEGKIPFSTGTYNNGNGGCIYIENGVVIPAP